MGFFARLFAARGLRPRRVIRPGPAAMGPTTRGLRRAARPGRPAKPGAASKAIKKARRILNPADDPVYSIERSITTSRRGRKKRKTTTEWRHGKCPVKHRSRGAAVRCRNP